MFRDYLVTKGYSGAVQDMERQWWAAYGNVPLIGTYDDVKMAALTKLLTPVGTPTVAWTQKQTSSANVLLTLTTPADTQVADQIFCVAALSGNPGAAPAPFVAIGVNALGNGQQNFYKATGLTPNTVYAWPTLTAQMAAMFICVRNALAAPVYTNNPKPATVSTSHPTIGITFAAGDGLYLSAVADRATPFVAGPTYQPPVGFTKVDSVFSQNLTDGAAFATMAPSTIGAGNWTVCQNTLTAATCSGVFKVTGAGAGVLVPGTINDLELRFWANLVGDLAPHTLADAKWLTLSLGKLP
jgi:hypothetical protein